MKNIKKIQGVKQFSIFFATIANLQRVIYNKRAQSIHAFVQNLAKLAEVY